MSKRKIKEGDPIAPIAEVKSLGLHERDVYIAAALSSAPLFVRLHDKFAYTADEICVRVIEVADRMMERKEGAA